jgi:hypothetical protein
VVVCVRRRLVIEHVSLRHPLPSRPRRRLYHGRQAAAEQAVGLAQVHDVDEDALLTLSVLHGEVEPKSENDN